MPEANGAVETAREKPAKLKENLVRAVATPVQTRKSESVERTERAVGALPTLYGHFTRFNEWTEIDSFWEGRFMERISPGAFKKTFREQTPKVLFQHGQDTQTGDKPLGAPDVLREEDEGPYYEVPMLDTSYNRDLIPGLEAGLYGASFRFSVMREEWVDEPDPSDHNPLGLPERTIKEVRCQEFGPVTFPAYPGATAGVRSMTDEFIVATVTSSPDKLRALLAYLERRDSRPTAEQTTREPAAPGVEPTPPPSRKATPDDQSTSLYIPKTKIRKGGVLL